MVLHVLWLKRVFSETTHMYKFKQVHHGLETQESRKKFFYHCSEPANDNKLTLTLK